MFGWFRKNKAAAHAIASPEPKPKVTVLTATETQRQFKALEDFDVDMGRGKSCYRRGQTYTIRPGNDVLATLADGWEAQGIIEWRDPVARVTGTGEVS